MRAVGKIGRDFDVTVNRTRMHDRDGLRGTIDFFFCDSKIPMVFSERREETAFLALKLYAQDIQRIHGRDDIFQAVIDSNPPSVMRGGCSSLPES